MINSYDFEDAERLRASVEKALPCMVDLVGRALVVAGAHDEGVADPDQHDDSIRMPPASCGAARIAYDSSPLVSLRPGTS